jgi:hypothetical protein
VINAALPIFALILTGYFCGRLKVLGDQAIDALNRFAVYLAFSALLFRAMTRITFEQWVPPSYTRSPTATVGLGQGNAGGSRRERHPSDLVKNPLETLIRCQTHDSISIHEGQAHSTVSEVLFPATFRRVRPALTSL